MAPSTLLTDYRRKSIYQEALAIWGLSYEARGDHLAVEALVEGERINGYPGALEQLADLFNARPVTTYVTPWQIAILYTRVGNKEKAISWLRKACYRAGKEVNDAVTVFVKDWLKGEIVSGTKTWAIQDVALAPAVSDSHHSSKTEANKPTPSSDEQRGTNTSEETPESPKEKAGLLGKLKKAKGIHKDQTRANLK